MKISISYPPLESEKGIALLSQNRQFQWFQNVTFIYPMVPASAATLIADRGHAVFWDDAIAEQLPFERWWLRLQDRKPEIIALESKTPVIKRHWRIVEKIKNECSWAPKVVLYGDHVTALPEESMENCPVDYVITGGDHDFVLADLVDSLANKSTLPGGVWYREEGEIKNTGAMDLRHDLNDLPMIDRNLTRWELYAYKNGNFKYKPGTYTMAGRDCWWGRCRFCSWTTMYPGSTYRTVTPERLVEEADRLVTDFGVKEIFDDSGCFPKGEWLHEFCEGVIKRGLNKKVVFGCNMRMGALSAEDWRVMKEANFRFVLLGLESVVQSTLDRLTKGVKVEEIENTLRLAKNAGLEPHITTMVGYPWEPVHEAEETISFAKSMFEKGYVDTLQATIVVPYPGTPMFDEAKEQGWLTTEDWDDYDMKQSVWDSPVQSDDVLKLTQGLYKAALNPRFIARKIMSIRSLDDIKYYTTAAGKLFAHIADFKGSDKKC